MPVGIDPGIGVIGAGQKHPVFHQDNGLGEILSAHAIDREGLDLPGRQRANAHAGFQQDVVGGAGEEIIGLRGKNLQGGGIAHLKHPGAEVIVGIAEPCLNFRPDGMNRLNGGRIKYRHHLLAGSRRKIQAGGQQGIGDQGTGVAIEIGIPDMQNAGGRFAHGILDFDKNSALGLRHDMGFLVDRAIEFDLAGGDPYLAGQRNNLKGLDNGNRRGIPRAIVRGNRYLIFPGDNRRRKAKAQVSKAIRMAGGCWLAIDPYRALCPGGGRECAIDRIPGPRIEDHRLSDIGGGRDRQLTQDQLGVVLGLPHRQENRRLIIG